MREYKSFPILTKEVGEDRVVRSLFAVFGNVDAGGDRIFPGAFKKTLQERGDRVRVLWQHDAMEPPIGVPVWLKEVGRDELSDEVKGMYPQASGGLLGEVRYLPTPRGEEVLVGIREGAIRENSIGYDVVKGKADFEDGVRNLRELRLWDISPVNWGMNEAARVVKSALPYKRTPLAPEDEEWNGPREFAQAEVDDLRVMCAWVDEENAENKTAYKLPHHKAGGEHECVWRGVLAAMNTLVSGARGGVDIPEGDRRKVYEHLARHYEDFGKEAPEFKVLEVKWGIEGIMGMKEGRVLSSRNLERLKAALETLNEILLAAEPVEDEVEMVKAIDRLLMRAEIAEKELSLLRLPSR